MTILLFVVKLLIVFFVGYTIYYKAVAKDTSGSQSIAIRRTNIIDRIFSYKRLRDIEISFKKLNIKYNAASVFALFIIGILIVAIAFLICKRIFPTTSVSAIISAPLFFSPIWVVSYIANKEQEKIESGLNDFFIQLKFALKVNSDIVEGLRRIQNIAIDPFSAYIKQLLVEVNSGKPPEEALDKFANKVNINKFSLYINNVRYCNIYGGDIVTLTEKTQNTITEAIKQKKKRIKETKSICVILYALIAIDFYMFFSFINGNTYYLDIMTNSFVGNLILDINFISIWGIIWLSRVVRKFDY